MRFCRCYFGEVRDCFGFCGRGMCGIILFFVFLVKENFLNFERSFVGFLGKCSFEWGGCVFRGFWEE